jgi:hypothetical protein
MEAILTGPVLAGGLFLAIIGFLMSGYIVAWTLGGLAVWVEALGR